VVREMESGKNEILRLQLPAVLEVQAGINHPRYASLKGIMAAKRKPIDQASAGRPRARRSRGRRRRLAARDRLGRFPRPGRGADARGRRRDGRRPHAGRQAAARKRGSSDAPRSGSSLQQRAGKLSRHLLGGVAAGQRLAAAPEAGGTAEAVVLGSGVRALADEVAGAALAGVHLADHANLADYTPGAYVGALAAAIAEAPEFVLFPHTYQTVDYFARLAQELGAGLLPEVTGFEEPGRRRLVWKRPILGGKLLSRVRAKGEGTTLVSVQSGAFPGRPSPARRAAPRSRAGGRRRATAKPTARSSASRRRPASRST
jgi:hypothetical protein